MVRQYAKQHHAVCRVLFIIIMPNVIILSVVMLSVVEYVKSGSLPYMPGAHTLAHLAASSLAKKKVL